MNQTLISICRSEKEPVSGEREQLDDVDETRDVTSK